jgi:hypothetical protein
MMGLQNIIPSWRLLTGDWPTGEAFYETITENQCCGAGAARSRVNLVKPDTQSEVAPAPPAPFNVQHR